MEISRTGAEAGPAHDHRVDVAVLGCGLMGAALARTFATAGLSVGVWNRTSERAEALASQYITPIDTLDDVVRATDLVVVCLTAPYDAIHSTLDPVEDWTGTTLVNLSTGTPADADVGAAWAAHRGIRYLDGGITCYPDQIGTERGIILYSGSRVAWQQHESTLLRLGSSSEWIGPQARSAPVLFSALTGTYFLSALNAFVEAAAYALEQGVDPEVLKRFAVSMNDLDRLAIECVDTIVADDYATDQARLATYTEELAKLLESVTREGYPGRMASAALANVEAAHAAGYGEESYFAMAKVLRRTPTG